MVRKVLACLLFLYSFSAQAAGCMVVLIPGAFGEGTSSLFIKNQDYFKEYQEFFTQKNCQVYKVVFPDNARLQERALMLRDQWEKFDTQNKKTLWVAHSIGGLAARFALKNYSIINVDALVTIGTPNLGSEMAEWAIKQKTKKTLIYSILKFFFDYDLAHLRFLEDLTYSVIDRGKSKLENQRRVRYGYSEVECVQSCGWMFLVLKYFTHQSNGDGIIETRSQPLGEFIGKYDLNHITTVDVSLNNQVTRQKLLNDLWEWFMSKV